MFVTQKWCYAECWLSFESLGVVLFLEGAFERLVRFPHSSRLDSKQSFFSLGGGFLFPTVKLNFYFTHFGQRINSECFYEAAHIDQKCRNVSLASSNFLMLVFEKYGSLTFRWIITEIRWFLTKFDQKYLQFSYSWNLQSIVFQTIITRGSKNKKLSKTFLLALLKQRKLIHSKFSYLI